LAYQALFFAMD